MVLFLERHRWVGILAIAAACAFFGHRAYGHLEEARAIEPPPARAPLARAPEVAPAPKGRTGALAARGQRLVERNLFCSGCSLVERRDVEPVASSRGGPFETELPLQLVAVRSGGGEIVAAIANTESHHRGAYGPGQVVPGAGRVERIASTHVEFVSDESGRLERLSLYPGRAAKPAPPEPEAPERSRRGGSADDFEERVARGVKEVGEDTFEVERALVDEVKANPMKAGRMRAMPALRGGEMVGLRLVGLSASSPLGRLGLRSGDVLLAVNGRKLVSPDAALGAYTQLKDATNLRLEIERRGQPKTLRYRVVD